MYFYKLLYGDCFHEDHEEAIMLTHAQLHTPQAFDAFVASVAVEAWCLTVQRAVDDRSLRFHVSSWRGLMAQVADVLIARHGFLLVEPAVTYGLPPHADFDNALHCTLHETQGPDDDWSPGNRRWTAIATALEAGGCFTPVEA